MRWPLALLLVALMLPVAAVSAAAVTTKAAPTEQGADKAALQAKQAAQEAAAAAAQAASDSDYQESTGERESQHDAADEQRDFVVRLERTACYGPCPIYSVTILGDRSATFVAPGLKSGKYSCCDRVRKTTLSIEDYYNLVKQVETMDFFKLNESFSAAITDEAGVRITVIAPYGMHSVWRYAVPCETEYRKGHHNHVAPAGTKAVDIEPDYLQGITPPPDSVCKLESMIDRLTGADNWGRGQTGTRGGN